MLVWAGVIVIARVHFVNEPNAAQAHCDLLVSLLVNIILIYAPQVSEELGETFVIRLTM